MSGHLKSAIATLNSRLAHFHGKGRITGKKSVGAGLAFLLTLCAPAIAQQILPAPVERPQIDVNGVDVQALSPNFSRSMLSIGPKGQGGLDYTMIWANLGGDRDSLYNMLHGTLAALGSSATDLQVGATSDSFQNNVSNLGE